MNLHRGRLLNWKPSRPKKFGRKYTLLHDLTTVRYQNSVDLRPHCPPVKDQGEIGACSGFSAAVHTEFLEIAEIKAKAPPNKALEFVANQFVPVSPLFIYNNERILEGTLDQDAGATTLGDACKALTTQGICREQTFPYRKENLFLTPPREAYEEAAKHKVPLEYALNQDINDLCTCLSAGFPFIFGIVVFDSMMTDAVDAHGFVPMPKAGDKEIGGHAITCVGYELGVKWIFQNSWGTGWGEKGFGFLPWNYMLDEELADDHFTLRYQKDPNA